MTRREKRLREALAQAKYTFNAIDCGGGRSLAEKGMEEAEKAMQKADLMEDGPSEEDKIIVRHLSDCLENPGNESRIKLYLDTVLVSSYTWTVSKLKQYMGIDQESKKKTDTAGANQP